MKQITQDTGRFYEKDGTFYPSVTTILGLAYPKGDFLFEWAATVGKDEADRIKKEAGEEGSAVHQAIESLLYGNSIPTYGLSAKQKKCLAAFIAWWEIEQPIPISTEYQINHEIESIIYPGRILRYAGSVDFKCRIKSDNYEHVYIIDFKTSKSVHDNYHAQIRAYIEADPEAERGAVLHLGNGTRAGWSFIETPLESSWRRFVLSLEFFFELNPNAGPRDEVVYPKVFKLTSDDKHPLLTQ